MNNSIKFTSNNIGQAFNCAGFMFIFNGQLYSNGLGFIDDSCPFSYRRSYVPNLISLSTTYPIIDVVYSHYSALALDSNG